jgi:hypothetical protein
VETSPGERTGIRNKKINQFEILARFEELAQNEEEIVEKQDELRTHLNSKSAIFKELQKLSSEFYLLYKKSRDNLQREEHDALVELAKDRMIVISKADKGADVAVQNIEDYMSKFLSSKVVKIFSISSIYQLQYQVDCSQRWNIGEQRLDVKTDYILIFHVIQR